MTMTINSIASSIQSNAASTGIHSSSHTYTVVDDFPTEILQAIFAEACGAEYIWVSSDATNTAFHLPDIPSPSLEPFAITLLHVCSRWRAITSITCTLWERVGLLLSPVEVSEDTSALSLRRLIRVLKYARKAPMSVSCEGGLDNNHHATLCDHLFRTSNQWKRARLRLTGATTLKPILQLKGRLALLESLYLYLVLEEPTEDSDDISQVFRLAPLLVDVTCEYAHWAFRFPWSQILHFSSTFRHAAHFQYAMRSLEHKTPRLQSLDLKAPGLFPFANPVANHHRVYTSLHTLVIAEAHSASRIISPSLTNLSINQYVSGRSTYTLLTVASSLVASSHCSLTSLSIDCLRPMPHELEPLREVLMLSSNMEQISIIVAQREPRRINRVARLLLNYFKDCAAMMRFLRSLSIELVVRDEEMCCIPGPMPQLELDTLDSVAVLVKAYAAPPFQIHDDRLGTAIALFSDMEGSELVSWEFTAAAEKTLDEILECRMLSLELVLKVKQTDTGCDWWILSVGPQRSVR